MCANLSAHGRHRLKSSLKTPVSPTVVLPSTPVLASRRLPAFANLQLCKSLAVTLLMFRNADLLRALFSLHAACQARLKDRRALPIECRRTLHIAKIAS